VGIVGADVVTLSGTVAGTFATKTVAVGKPVTVTGLTLGGANAGNYTLTQPTSTANITAVNLTVTGVTAEQQSLRWQHQRHDQHQRRNLVGRLGADVVTLSGTAKPARLQPRRSRSATSDRELASPSAVPTRQLHA